MLLLQAFPRAAQGDGATAVLWYFLFFMTSKECTRIPYIKGSQDSALAAGFELSSFRSSPLSSSVGPHIKGSQDNALVGFELSVISFVLFPRPPNLVLSIPLYNQHDDPILSPKFVPSVLKMNRESSNEGSQSGSNSVRASDGGGSQNSKAGTNYSGVVAQRALYGSYKRRVGRRMASKSAPSRLGKVSAADGNDT